MEQYLFCSCKDRPPICKLKTNLCCLVCQFNNECSKSVYVGIKPCKPDFDEDEEKCPYLV